jgi:hypothetical protein
VVTPSNEKEALSHVTAHCAQDGVKGGNKRCKQCLQRTMTTMSRDVGLGWEVGGSDTRRISTAVGSDKRRVRPPTDHFKWLLEEACPNHAYPVKLKDCGMM